MAKYKIPEDEVNRMRDALLAAFDVAIAGVENDEWNDLLEDRSNVQHLIGESLRYEGREVCVRIEHGEFRNATT